MERFEILFPGDDAVLLPTTSLEKTRMSHGEVTDRTELWEKHCRVYADLTNAWNQVQASQNSVQDGSIHKYLRCLQAFVESSRAYNAAVRAAVCATVRTDPPHMSIPEPHYAHRDAHNALSEVPEAAFALAEV